MKNNWQEKKEIYIQEGRKLSAKKRLRNILLIFLAVILATSSMITVFAQTGGEIPSILEEPAESQEEAEVVQEQGDDIDVLPEEEAAPIEDAMPEETQNAANLSVFQYISGEEVSEDEAVEYALGINGQKEARAYKLYDVTTDPATELGTFQTDAVGRFSLQNGRLAVFEEIEQGSEYTIEGSAQEGFSFVVPENNGEANSAVQKVVENGGLEAKGVLAPEGSVMTLTAQEIKQSEQTPTEETVQEEQENDTAATDGINPAADPAQPYEYSLAWISPQAGNHLELEGDNSYSPTQMAKYQLTFHNNTDYAIGEVEIRLPRYLNAYRVETNGQFTAIGVPAAPNTSVASDFNYTIDTKTNEIVLKNARPLPAGSNNLIQVTHDLRPMQIVDSKLFDVSATIKVKEEAPVESNVITGVMDTKVVMNPTKSYYTMHSSLPDTPIIHTWNQYKAVVPAATWDSEYDVTGEEPADFQDYVYFYCIIGINLNPISGVSTGNTSQPATIVLTDTPSNGGEIIASQNSNYFVKQADGTFVFDTEKGASISSGAYTWSSRGSLTTVVRYPRALLPADGKVTNTLSVTATPVDGVEAPITKEVPLELTWREFEYEYPGDYYSDQKSVSGRFAEAFGWDKIKMDMLEGVDSPFSSMSLSSDMRIYDITKNQAGKTFTHTMVDDHMFLRFNSDVDVALTPDDYYYSSLGGAFYRYEYSLDKAEGKEIVPGDGYTDTRIYGMKAANPGVWELLCTVPRTSNPVDLRTYLSDEDLQAMKVYRIKVEADLVEECFRSYILANPTIKLYSDSPTVNAAIADGKELKSYTNAMATYLRDNTGTHYNTEAYGGTARLKNQIIANDTVDYGGSVRRQVVERAAFTMKFLSDVTKSASAVNDTVNSRVNIRYNLYANEYTNATASELIAAGMGESFARKEGVFYDLLPMGIQYNPDVKISITGATSVAGDYELSSFEVINNYKGSGRQMLVFHVKYTGGSLNLRDDNSSFANARGLRSRTGFIVSFGAYYPWNSYGISNNQYNYMAYQAEATIHDGTGFADEGTGSGAPTAAQVPTTDGQPVFYDLAQNGSVDTNLKNTKYASAKSDISIAVATATGLSKRVKEDADTLAEYEKEARVAVNETYTYRLMVQNTDGGTMKDVVIYDRLERAAVDRAGLEADPFDPSWWQGEYTRVNTLMAKMKGIQPVVYYSAKADAAYDLNDPVSGWTTDPSTLSAVRAVAVDLSKKTDGTDFVFDPLEGAYVTITMRAPNKLQLPANYAYNNAAFNSTFIAATGEVKTELVACDSVRTKLYERAPFEVSKTVTGFNVPDNQSFTFKVEINGSAYAKKEYTLWTNGVKEDGVYYTTSAGALTLKHGQKAVFESTAVGDVFKVTETAKSGFVVTPAGGIVEGTLPKSGSSADFVNRYTSNDASLEIRKSVQTSNGLAHPGDVAEFTFLVNVSGAPFANQGYKLYNSTTNVEITNGAPFTTDANGKLKLKHNQKAVFSELLLGAPYEIIEESHTDYRQISPADGASFTGTLSRSNTKTFVNQYEPKRDLAIQKTVTSTGGFTAPADDVFTFVVDVGGTAYAGKEYKLYGSDGVEITSGAPYSTDAAGKLTLKHGQKAIFSEVSAGTAYTVTEESAKDYTKVSPSGNASGTVSDGASGSTASFVNNYSPMRPLVVKKTVVGTGAPIGDDFTFEVNVEGLAYANQAYKLYDNGMQQIGVYQTDVSGRLTLKHNQEARFESVLVGSGYEVKEIAREDYVQTVPAYNASVTGNILLNGNSSAFFTNLYEPKRDLTIEKHVTGTGAPADDVFEFVVKVSGTLYANKEYKLFNASGTLVTTGAPFSTDAAGKLTLKGGERAVFEGIVAGTSYEVVETAHADYTTTQTGSTGTIAQSNGAASVFTNNYEPKRSLEITKTVTASPGFTAPAGDAFAFVVTVDGSLYRYQAYKLYDISDPANPVAIPGSYTTDTNGKLALTASQKAVFEGIDVGTAFEIAESSKDGYVQTQPSGGSSVSGSIGMGGGSAAFENNYEPKQGLTIEKKVTGNGAPTDDAFEFTVNVSGTVYANQAYKLFGSDGAEVAGSFSTDAAGKLNLEAGQRAVFEGILQNTAYEVVETPKADYVQTNPANGGSANGTIAGTGSVATFTNAYTPLRNVTVEKHVTGSGAPADEFEFIVTVGGTVHANKVYKLYGSDGVEVTGSFSTDAAGKLTLKDGEKAVFEGIVAGTNYTVVETAKADYTTTQTGNTGVVAADNSSTAVFTNNYEPKRSLEITKTVTASAGFIAPAGDEFEFTVMVDNAAYVNKAYKLYNATTGAQIPGNYATDDNGKLKLTNNRKVVFESIDVGTTFEVVEAAKDGYVQVSPNGSASDTVGMTGGNAAFVNNYEPKQGLTVKKTVTGSSAPASDVFEFTVNVGGAAYANKAYKLYENGVQQIGVYQTDAAGQLELKNNQEARFEGILQNTAYEVVETPKADYVQTAPSGGGSASGMVSSAGSTASFVNAYTPLRNLAVEKHVTGTGAPTDDVFEFAVTLGGAAHANKAYKLYGSDGVEVAGSFSTDAAGKLTLKDGEKAVFEGIVAGTAYTVVETAKADYTTTQTGNTGTVAMDNSSLAVFTNNYEPKRSLEITKTVTASPGFTAPAGDEFEFTVTVNGTAYVNKAYKLYNIATGAQIPGNYATDDNGKLKLMDNRKAVFEGIDVGTTFEVVETAKDGYVQASPNGSASGSIGMGGESAAFENNYEPKQGLTVQKTVAGTNAPEDDAFEFTVNVSGAPYANQAYKLFGSDGVEFAGSFSTDAAGKLTLKNGEKAVFEGILQNTAYEVMETPKTDYVQTDPVGGSASGTVSSLGSIAGFVNTYTPLRNLAVEKHVTGTGAPVGDEFEFIVTVGGTAHANKAYKLYGSDGVEVAGSFSTDAAGKLTLKDGEKAVFEGIVAGTAYTVVEIAKADYITTQTGNTGTVAMDNSSSAVFTNNYEPKRDLQIIKMVTASAGFTAPTGDEFEFTVMVDGAAYVNKAYKLYNATTNTQIPGNYATDDNGKMKLTANRRAVFEGIDVGTTFEVVEIAKDGYVQVSPNGSADGTITANGGNVMFVNNYEPKQGLTVKKTVTGSGAPTDDVFEFTVNVGGAVYANKAYKLFENGVQQIGIYETDAAGKLELKHNQEAVFEGILQNTAYEVVETPKTDYVQTAPSGGGSASGTVSSAGSTASFVNAYTPLRNLTVEKQVTGSGAPADDTFEFTVTVGGAAHANKAYKLYGSDGVEVTAGAPFSTDAAGKLTLKDGEKAVFEGIVAGTNYTVVETAKADYTTTKTGNTGTVAMDNSSSAVFTNNYEPKRSLEISKTVTASAGFTAPDTDAFTFTVTVGGALYRYQAYKLYDISDPANPAEIPGNYTTDTNGRLVLAADQKAVFAGIDVGTTFEVVETAKDGYVQVSPNGSASGSIGMGGESAAFENNYEPKQGLTVQKTVAGANAPADDAFEFTVNVGGTPYANQAYKLFGSDGVEVAGSFSTDAAGKLTLKNGEKAVFEGILQNTAYEVVETPKTDYVQTDPVSGGSASGTVSSLGSIAGFVNTYTPLRNLTVEKYVTGSGAPVGDAFEFTVNVSGAAHANKAYKLYGSDGLEVAGSFSTDAAGKLTLKDGEKAVFEGIVAGTAYTVVETAKADYTTTQTGDASVVAMDNSSSAVFTNNYEPSRAIVVSKTVTGTGAPTGDEFTFTITVDGAAYGNREYKLYNLTTGVQVPGIYATDDDGNFKLTTNRKAIFEGVSVGSAYEIVEAPKADYVATPEEYTGMLTVGGASASFVNDYAPKRTLAVEKTVVGEDAPTSDVFEFEVAIDGVAYANEAYKLYNKTTGAEITTGWPFRTDIEGKLTLAAGQKAVFDGIAASSSYEVKETTQDSYQQVSPQNGTTTGSIGMSGAVASFTNRYLKPEIAVQKTSDKMVNTDPNIQGQLVSAGDEITYTLKVVNTGEGPARNVTLRDYIPEGTTYKAGSASDAGTLLDVKGKPCLNWNIQEVLVGSANAIEITFTVTVDEFGSTPVEITNAALHDNGNEIPKTPGDPDDPETPTNELNNQTVYYEKVSSPAGGTIDEFGALVNPGQVREGDIITYDINVTASKGGSKNIVMTDDLPDGVSLVSGSVSYQLGNGARVTLDEADVYTNGVVTWPKVDIPEGVSNFRLKVMVDNLPEGEVQKAIGNNAVLKQDNPDGTDKEYPPTGTVTHEVKTRKAEISKTAAVVEEDRVLDEERGLPDAPVDTELRQMVEYHLTITNTGADGMKSGDIVVTDPIPKGCSFVEGSAKGEIKNKVSGSTAMLKSAEMTEGGVKWVLNGLDNGEQGYLTFRVYAPSTCNDPSADEQKLVKVFTNQARMTDVKMSEAKCTETFTTVDKDCNKTEYTKNTTIYAQEEYVRDSEITYHQVKEPLVTIVKSSDPASPAGNGLIPVVQEGDTITYTLTIMNTGEAAAKNVRVADFIPSDTTYMPHSASHDGVFTEEEGRVDWTIADLPIGEDNKVELTFQVRVDRITEDGPGVITNVGYVYTPQLNDPNPPVDPADPTPPVDEYTPSNKVQHQTHTFVKVSNPVGGTDEESATKVNQGQAITYTMQFSAGDAVQNVSVTDVVPQGLAVVAGSISIIAPDGTVTQLPDSAYNSATRVITWTANSIQSGVTGFRFKAVVEKLAEGETAKLFENRASITYDPGVGAPVTEESNVVTHKAQAGASEITKSAALVENGAVKAEANGTQSSPVKTDRGQIVEYRLRVTRTGAPSGDLVITDAIPEGTTFVEGSATGSIQNLTDGSKAKVTSVAVKQVNTPEGQMKNGVEWIVNGLREGETAYLTFRVYAPKTTDDPKTPEYEYAKVFENTAQMEDKENAGLFYEEDVNGNKKGEPVYKNEDAVKVTETTYHVVKEPMLEANKSSDPGKDVQLKAGDTITYTIAVANKGESVANNVIVRDAIPEGTTFVAGSEKCSVAGTNADKVNVDGREGLAWIIPQIEPGETVTVSFAVTVNELKQAGTANIKNVAQVKESIPGEDPKDPSKEGFKNTNEVSNIQSQTYAAAFPKTGDDSHFDMNMVMLFVVAGIALSGLLILVVVLRRRRQAKETYDAYRETRRRR